MDRPQQEHPGRRRSLRRSPVERSGAKSLRSPQGSRGRSTRRRPGRSQGARHRGCLGAPHRRGDRHRGARQPRRLRRHGERCPETFRSGCGGPVPEGPLFPDAPRGVGCRGRSRSRRRAPAGRPEAAGSGCRCRRGQGVPDDGVAPRGPHGGDPGDASAPCEADAGTARLPLHRPCHRRSRGLWQAARPRRWTTSGARPLVHGAADRRRDSAALEAGSHLPSRSRDAGDRGGRTRRRHRAGARAGRGRPDGDVIGLLIHLGRRWHGQVHRLQVDPACCLPGEPTALPPALRQFGNRDHLLHDSRERSRRQKASRGDRRPRDDRPALSHIPGKTAGSGSSAGSS